ncbi:hypothetical protein F4819DRAFT_484556 [Hypoxylon fuscum]|nr:hypothetical protein F4819DRAFT_484556 [Hypoxylon fuscum]
MTTNSQITDFTPFAMIGSPLLALFYCFVCIYACMCVAAGFRVAYARCDGGTKSLLCLPPWPSLLLAGLGIALLLAALAVPGIVVAAVWRLLPEKLRSRVRTRRRGGGRGFRLRRRKNRRPHRRMDRDSFLSSDEDDEEVAVDASVGSLSLELEPLPRYTQLDRNAAMEGNSNSNGNGNGAVMRPRVQTPPPAYLGPGLQEREGAQREV